MSEMREAVKAKLQDLDENQLVDVLTNLKYPEGSDKTDLVEEILDLYDTTLEEGNVSEEEICDEVCEVIDDVTTEPPED